MSSAMSVQSYIYFSKTAKFQKEMFTPDMNVARGMG